MSRAPDVQSRIVFRACRASSRHKRMVRAGVSTARMVIRGRYLNMALVKNPLFARYFDRCGARNEERGNRELRRGLLAGLSGRVLEAGAGNGLNFPHYPASVHDVVAVEPAPYLRGRALEAA